MPNSLPIHPALISSMYYEQHREWDDYVYKGIYGLKEISLRYEVPFSLLIARLKKEYPMVMRSIQDKRINFLQPLLSFESATLWTTSMPTAIVPIAIKMTIITIQRMTSHR